MFLKKPFSETMKLRIVSKTILWLLLLIYLHQLSFSQQDSLDFYDYDFNQLSKFKITSASKVPEKIGEVPVTVLVITATEIKEKGYFTLDEVLSDLPGFQFRNTLGLNGYIFQRGIPNQNNLTLLLIDGIQVNELNSGGFYGGGQYNLSNVDHIEVVYGPASVTYGTNALSGIINIITKNETERQFEMNTLLGSFETMKMDVGYGYTSENKNFGIRISGMYKQSDKADLKGTAGDNNWTDLMDNYENDYAFDLKIKTNNFTLGMNYLQKKASTATFMKSTGTIYRDYGTSWNIRFINNYLKFNKDLTDKLTLNSTLYNRNATVLDNSVYFVVDTAQIGYYRPNNLTGFENVLIYNTGRYFSMSGGLTLEYEALAKTNSSSYSNSPVVKPPTPEKPAMDKNYLVSFFLEPRFVILKSLNLSGGIRFDHSSIYDQVLTPRAGLGYAYKNQIIRFSFAGAFRAPKPWDYTDGLGNTSLLPEKMRSLEAAVTLSISKNHKVDIIGYKNILGNAITKQNVDEEYKWINEGKIKTEGIEISFRYSSQKLKSLVNYTFNQSKDEHNTPIPEISNHCANASITYSFNNYLKMNLRANYIGKRENPKVIVSTNSNFVDPCLIFQGALSLMNYKGFDLQFIVRNIFNTVYYHTSNRMPDRYRQPQRTIMLTVGYSLKNKE
jgi:outer membrane receptor for ferrienterochelin and colicins